ncbi:MAG: DUF3857 domain-containing protein, partial [Prevotella sp.]|nr:DUF3857 domain-containing protein [Prevotella sp.]
MKTLCSLALFLCSLFVFQQNYAQSKYGNATMDELTMQVYPQDTTAAAVILLKKGEARFKVSELYGFQFEYTLQVKIKILKTEGLKWCNGEIEYYEASNSSKEQINGLSGTTYNLENGKIIKTKLSKEYITDEDVDNKYKIKKFSMPAAKIGSVIEYKYTIVSDFYYELREFRFQESIPVAYTYYEAKIPEYFTYNVNFQGYVLLKTVREPENESFHIGGQRIPCSAEMIKSEGFDIPAMKEEGYLWSANDYISKVSFELRSTYFPGGTVRNYSSSWDKIDRDLLSSGVFGGNTKKADMFKEEIQKGDLTLERAREIQNMIKYRVKWNERNALYPRNLKDALKTGLGNNADINFLLINALKAGGFDAFPVALSTRSNGRLPFTHPSIAALNYVITGVKIDTVVYFTDAAAKYGDWNLLPEKCMVPRAHILKENACGWANLTSISKGMVMKTGKFEFSGNEYIGRITDSRNGNEAYELTGNYYRHKDKEAFIETLSKNISCEIDSFGISNLDNTAEAVKIEYIQKTNIDMGEEFIYINPMINKQLTENPFRTETRVYPINFDYLTSYMQIIEIKIPEGYVVDEMPKPARLVMNDNDIALSYRIGVEGNLIKLYYVYQLRKLEFPVKEYDAIRDFYAKLVAKNSEQIVL